MAASADDADGRYTLPHGSRNGFFRLDDSGNIGVTSASEMTVLERCHRSPWFLGNPQWRRSIVLACAAFRCRLCALPHAVDGTTRYQDRRSQRAILTQRHSCGLHENAADARTNISQYELTADSVMTTLFPSFFRKKKASFTALATILDPAGGDQIDQHHTPAQTKFADDLRRRIV